MILLIYLLLIFHHSSGYRELNSYNLMINGHSEHPQMSCCNWQKMIVRTCSQLLRPTTGVHSVTDITHYSMIDKVVVNTAYVFIHNAHKQQPCLTWPLTATKWSITMKQWISSSRASSYLAEFIYSNLIRQLYLYLDKNKHIRCSGRINNVPINDATPLNTRSQIWLLKTPIRNSTTGEYPLPLLLFNRCSAS